eukprot:295148-Chlamydomonas_euryale.AAC.6
MDGLLGGLLSRAPPAAPAAAGRRQVRPGCLANVVAHVVCMRVFKDMELAGVWCVPAAYRVAHVTCVQSSKTQNCMHHSKVGYE